MGWDGWPIQAVLWLEWGTPKQNHPRLSKPESSLQRLKPRRLNPQRSQRLIHSADNFQQRLRRFSQRLEHPRQTKCHRSRRYEIAKGVSRWERKARQSIVTRVTFVSSRWRNIPFTLIAPPAPSAQRISPDQFRLLQSSSMDISGNRGHDRNNQVASGGHGLASDFLTDIPTLTTAFLTEIKGPIKDPRYRYGAIAEPRSRSSARSVLPRRYRRIGRHKRGHCPVRTLCHLPSHPSWPSTLPGIHPCSTMCNLPILDGLYTSIRAASPR
jgi:hypothetical protein